MDFLRRLHPDAAHRPEAARVLVPASMRPIRAPAGLLPGAAAGDDAARPERSAPAAAEQPAAPPLNPPAAPAAAAPTPAEPATAVNVATATPPVQAPGQAMPSPAAQPAFATIAMPRGRADVPTLPQPAHHVAPHHAPEPLAITRPVPAAAADDPARPLAASVPPAIVTATRVAPAPTPSSPMRPQTLRDAARASAPAPAPAPVLHVTIDRIDVRLPPAAARATRADSRPRPASAQPALGDYLRPSGGGHGSRS